MTKRAMGLSFAIFLLAPGTFGADNATTRPNQAAASPSNAEPKPAAVETPAPSDDAGRLLTVERIFATREFQEERVGAIVWSRSSGSYYTLKKLETEDAGPALIRVDAASGSETVVAPPGAFIPSSGAKPLNVEGFSFSADEAKLLIYTQSQRVWRHNTRGDYWVLDLATQDLKKLGGDASPSTLMFAKFSPDGSRVAYVRENNLYVQELASLRVQALTSDGSARRIHGTSDWVNEEELEIRDGFRFSPDGHSIAFWSFDTTGVEEFHLLDNSRGKYPRLISFPYPKVGTTNSASRIGVVSVSGGDIRWLDAPGDPREHYLPRMEWSPDGGRILFQQMNRLQNRDRVMLWDANTGAIETILTETDPAWLENENPVRWTRGGKEFVWLSERSGWRHVYRASVDGGELVSVTQGELDVIAVEAIDEANGWLYFAASPDDPTRRFLYRTPLDGGAIERMSPANRPGWHTYEISPDAKWAVHSYSTFMSPPVVELIRLADHRPVRTLADNSKSREMLAKLDRPSGEFFRVEIADGLSLDGWRLLPPSFDPSGKFPLLFHVYGEPYGQTVRDAWRGPQGLWHWMLAQRGYLVASVDNRGTNVPRGRAWRKCVHRQIGVLAPEEQAAAARALLRRWSFADPSRVGIWGWSGGGSMSLNAIFRFPDLYRAAIAVAPNADQLLYDTIYQERYMGLPSDNAEGYRLGSPITHARGLQGDLLIVHGTGDDNGHYQGTEKLIDELIAHGKRFAVMPYPGRSHAIQEGRNTVPHFYSLLTDYLRDHLPVEHRDGSTPAADVAEIKELERNP